MKACTEEMNAASALAEANLDEYAVLYLKAQNEMKLRLKENLSAIDGLTQSLFVYTIHYLNESRTSSGACEDKQVV